MSSEIDFKSLWNKQPTGDVPDTKELFAKADKVKRRTRCTIIALNIMLIAISIFVTYIGWNIDHAKLTTKIGVVLMVIGMISYVAAYNQIIPILFKTDVKSNSHDYLDQLIRIKRKEDFINKVMVNIYFTLLSAGLFLYMLQFSVRMTMLNGSCYFIITFAWIGICWFLHPRLIRKKRKALNDVITRLEEVNKQLDVDSAKE
jgi:F0F1-type ATP synthase assembly protein I